MEDAQFPSVAGDAQGTPQRRSGLRLSDAETVATTRLDMFGDKALKDALASAPPHPDEGRASDGTAPEPSAHQPPPFLDAVIVSAGPASTEPAIVEAAPQPVEASPKPPPSTDLQGPDAVHDTADAADVARDLGPADTGMPSPARLRPLDPDWSSAAAPAPHPDAPTAYLEFSPVFSALDEAERRAQALWNGEAAAPAPYGALVPAPHAPPEADGLDDRSAQSAREVQVEHDALAETASVDAAPADAEAPAVAAMEAPEAPPVGEPGAAPDSPQASQHHDWSPPFGGEPSGPSGPPPFREDLAAPVPVFDAAAPAELPLDAAAQIAAEADATAQALENLKRLLETNSPDLEPVLRPMVHPQPMVRPQPTIRPLPMAEPDEAFGAGGYAPPRAEGLGLRIGPQTEAPSLAGTTAPLLPLPVPPPPERSSRRGIYVLGFLSGLGLSLMTGIVLYFVLYFVINTTG